MKRTLTINLNGIVFHINDDAYSMLQEYLQKIEHNLGKGEDTADVMQDIEARIGELFTVMLHKSSVQVVDETMVRQVMKQLGSPEAFADDEESDKGQKKKDEGQKTVAKHLYRDKDNELLGGVCSGLAAYTGIDAVWIRLLFVFFTVVYGAAFFLYILLWVIVPAARTAAQRLEMRGVEPSVSNIEQEVRRTKDIEPSNKGCLRSGVSLLLKSFIGICLLFTVPALLFAIFIIGVVLVSLISTFFGAMPAMMTSFPLFNEIASTGDAGWILLLLLFSLSIILIPIIMLVHWLITHFRKHEVVSARFWWITGILWLVSLFGTGVMSIYAAHHHFNAFSLAAGEMWDDDYEDYAPITYMDELDAFHSIVVSGHADIDISQNPVQRVTMRTIRPDLYEVEVRDSVLYISCKEHRHPIDVDFTIAVAEVRSITSSGACSVENHGMMSVNNLYIQTSGAADIDLTVQAQTITLQSSGASEAELKGTTDHLQITISGAGEVDAFGLRARTANVTCSGAGQVDVFVLEDLAAQAMGASKIEYRGNPMLSKSITGGMGVIRRDRY